ncbi:MAG: peptidoglycan-binding domain-containing protein [Dermatophilaceae bacterium]
MSASVIAFPLVGSTAGAASVPVPRPTRALPSALDVAPPYQKGTRCLTEAQPGPVAFAKLLNATYGNRAYGIVRPCAAEHGEGRALDWMISAHDPQQRTVADTLTRWLSAPDAQGRPGAMARRFGINYIIWNRQSWRAFAPDRGWTPYTGASPHTDHIHISFTWDGASARTSWWTGIAVTAPLTGPTGALMPPPSAAASPTLLTSSGYPHLRKGASGAEVKLAQKAVGAAQDGRFGPLTAAAVGRWQAAHGVRATTELDNATWARMVALRQAPTRSHPLERYARTVLRRGATGDVVAALQRAIGGVQVDGSFGPLTEARVVAYQRTTRLAATGVADLATWYALMSRMTPPSAPSVQAAPPPPRGSAGSAGPAVTSAAAARTTAFTSLKATVLRRGSSGAPVRILQQALGGLAVDGRFGPRTDAALVAFQRSARLPGTGVADRGTWEAVERRAHPLLPYWGTVLRRGSGGPGVQVLQRALRVTPDGSFGPVTEAAVRSVQQRARIAQTGVVGTLTWRAVEARMPR